MSSTPSLTDDLIETLATMRGEINPATQRRWTLIELAAWATAKTGAEVGRMTVCRLTAPVRAERARIVREATRERITARLVEQVDALDTMVTAIADDFTAAPTPAARREAFDAFQKGLALKLRYSGVGEAIEVSGDLTTDATLTVVDARSQLAAQLARAAAGAAAGAAGGTPGEPVAGGGGGTPP